MSEHVVLAIAIIALVLHKGVVLARVRGGGALRRSGGFIQRHDRLGGGRGSKANPPGGVFGDVVAPM